MAESPESSFKILQSHTSTQQRHFSMLIQFNASMHHASMLLPLG
jgi:hypothetical protein